MSHSHSYIRIRIRIEYSSPFGALSNFKCTARRVTSILGHWYTTIRTTDESTIPLCHSRARTANSCSKLNGTTPTAGPLGTHANLRHLRRSSIVPFLFSICPTVCAPLDVSDHLAALQLSPPPPPSPFLNSFYLKPKWNILRWLWQCRPRLSNRNCGVWTSIGHGHGQRHGSSFSRAHIIKFAQRTSHTHTRTHTLKHCTQFVCQAKPKKEWDKIHKSEKRISTDYREYFVRGLLQQRGERATGEEDVA